MIVLFRSEFGAVRLCSIGRTDVSACVAVSARCRLRAFAAAGASIGKEQLVAYSRHDWLAGLGLAPHHSWPASLHSLLSDNRRMDLCVRTLFNPKRSHNPLSIITNTDHSEFRCTYRALKITNPCLWTLESPVQKPIMKFDIISPLAKYQFIPNN